MLPIAPFADSSTKAVTLIFVADTCPVANAFQPSLAAFHKAYADQAAVKHIEPLHLRGEVRLDLLAELTHACSPGPSRASTDSSPERGPRPTLRPSPPDSKHKPF